MTLRAMPSANADLIIGLSYDPTGLAWVAIYDNLCMGWIVDDADPSHPAPVIIGSMFPDAPSTPGVESPSWAHATQKGGVMVPDKWRGQAFDFFDWLATNGGANRKLRNQMDSQIGQGAFALWAARRPALVMTREPPGFPFLDPDYKES